MISTAATAAPGFQLTGAIRYLHDERKSAEMGMGVVARFGGHNAGFYLALQKRPNGSISRSPRDACEPASRMSELKLLAGTSRARVDSDAPAAGILARFACQVYDRSGHFAQTIPTGHRLDLSA